MAAQRCMREFSRQITSAFCTLLTPQIAAGLAELKEVRPRVAPPHFTASASAPLHAGLHTADGPALFAPFTPPPAVPGPGGDSSHLHGPHAEFGLGLGLTPNPCQGPAVTPRTYTGRMQRALVNPYP